ncbi:MAG: hypothetical protein AB1758_35510 [Candidatus Eremiobacterota bacterium]
MTSTQGGASTSNVPVDVKEFWRKFLLAVKPRDVRLHAVLVEARVKELTPESLVLGLPEGYRWHHEVLSGSRAQLESLAQELLGRTVVVQLAGDGPGPQTRGASGPTGGARLPAEGEEHDRFIQRASGMFPGQIMEGET